MPAPTRRLLTAAAILVTLALPAAASALPAPGQTGLPLPRAGYSGDLFGGTIDMRNDQRLVVKPAAIRIGNEEWSQFRRLVWSGWGSTAARGRGPVWRCAENGCTRRGTGVVKLRGRKTFGCESRRRTVRVYTRIGFVVPGFPGTDWYTITPGIYC